MKVVCLRHVPAFNTWSTAARTGHNSLPLRFVLAFGRAGTVNPSNRGAEEEGSCVFTTKPATNVKDTSPQPLE